MFKWYPLGAGAHASASANRSGAGFGVPGAGGRCDAHTRTAFAAAPFDCPPLSAAVTSQTCTKPSARSVVTNSLPPNGVECGVTSTIACPTSPLIPLHTRLSVPSLSSHIVANVRACTTTPCPFVPPRTTPLAPHDPNAATREITPTGARATWTTSSESRSRLSPMAIEITHDPSSVAHTNLDDEVESVSSPRVNAHDVANALGARTRTRDPALEVTHTLWFCSSNSHA
mmetsp:Transcript_7561/g.27649  ORF Transcript_7561/g.27649 Transcript_7561/m.27649 type:complete len:229 (+) Transcript_7561:5684-6370(+)